jgi:predicted membrane channel-forming protein YqfA (hemolysin III family)
MFGYVVGYILFGLVISFAVIGLCWLIGWRKNPKWRARFWWVTFALAGVIVTGTAIGTPPKDHMGLNIAGIILFIIALVLKKN